MGKATGFRRSEEAHSQEEGQDHQEDRAAYGVLQVQEEDPVPHQEDQALRVGWRQEEEGTDDPVLNWNEDSSLFSVLYVEKVILFYMGRKIYSDKLSLKKKK